MIKYKGMMLRNKPALGECPYCLKPVGVLGNWFAYLFGTGFHNCNFSNYIGEIKNEKL